MKELLLTFLLSLSDGTGQRDPSPAERLLGPARAGDKAAHDELIRAYTPLVLRGGQPGLRPVPEGWAG